MTDRRTSATPRLHGFRVVTTERDNELFAVFAFDCYVTLKAITDSHSREIQQRKFMSTRGAMPVETIRGIRHVVLGLN